MSNELKDLKAYLKDHPNPSVKIIGTLVSRGVSLIRPVPRLFGAEVHCHANVYDDVLREIKANKLDKQA